jgi:hypothetical protein
MGESMGESNSRSFDVRRRNLRFGLLATASVAALLAIEPASADPLFDPNGWWTSVEGDYLFASGSSQPLFVGYPSGIPNQSDHVRDALAVELSAGGGFAFDPAWDFRLAYTGLRSQRHRKNISGATTGTSSPYQQTLGTDIQQSFDIGDFDIGRNFGLGAGNLRVFGGLRFAWFDQLTKLDYVDVRPVTGNPPDIAEAKGDSHSWGLGPRIGLSGSYPLAELGFGKLSLTGTIAAAMLFGDADRKLSQSESTHYNASPSSATKSSATQSMYNLDGKLGLSFAFPLQGTEASFTVGYMLTSWWNVINTQGVLALSPLVPPIAVATPTTSTKSGSQLYQGPFVNFTVKF